MNPNWIKWKVGDKVEDVLVFVVRQYRKEFDYPEGMASPILIAGCSNYSGKKLGWECRLGRSKKRGALTQEVTRLHPQNPNDRRVITLFDPDHDVLYYTKDKFLDVPDIDEGRHVHISFEEILYSTGSPNIFEGRVTDKERERHTAS